MKHIILHRLLFCGCCRVLVWIGELGFRPLRNECRLDKTLVEHKKNLIAADTQINELTSNLENAKVLEKLKEEERDIEIKLRAKITAIDDFHQGVNKKIFTEGWLLRGCETLIDSYVEKLGDYNTKKILKKRLKSCVRI